MITIAVKLKERSYSIQIGAGLLDETGALLRAALGERARNAIIVSNPTVDALYGDRVGESFRRAGFAVWRFLIGDGERFKTLRTADDLYKFLIEQRIERSDVMVALGGGVVGDF